MRINKYLSTCGLCSRREADRLLAAGRVSINGEPAATGAQVEEGMEVCVDGVPVRPLKEHSYVLLNKPVGVVCTADPREKNNVIDYLHWPVRLTYAGRLDRNSEGLLLLTDDGDLIDALMRGRFAHEKEYEVTLSRDLTEEELERLRSGVELGELGRTTRPCDIDRTGERRYRFVLTQGLNRQIRRMCAAVRVGVRRMKRLRIATLSLGTLRPGEHRELTAEELRLLRESCGL